MNEELDVFCLEISTRGLSFVNLVAQTMTNRLAELLEFSSDRKPLRRLKSRYECEKKLFVAKLTMNDVEMDRGLADKLTKDLMEHILFRAKKFARDKFKNLIDTERERFAKTSIIRNMENKCEEIYERIKANQQYQLTPGEINHICEMTQLCKEPK